MAVGKILLWFLLTNLQLLLALVNTAAMMEDSSEPGKIQCSEETYRLLARGKTDQTDPTDFKVKERGIIQVDGKGDMKTFWIEPGTERLERC